ncbi:MAG: hypothetical protein HKN08_12945 [Gammaproteobacteria bacterium]|nr:hypothetical protein [Gammaproteobacteria bacterium]
MIFFIPLSSLNVLADYEEISGALPDGTAYQISVPDNWNKVLIRDLDFVSNMLGPNVDRVRGLLQNGYAVAGTARHALRKWQYDPAHEIGNLIQVQNLFVEKFGKPVKVIQYGFSGGGHVTLATAEDFSDGIDGAVALAAHTPVWIMNSFLDGWFVLRSLISQYYVDEGYGPASDLQYINLPNDNDSATSGHGMVGPIVEAWQKAFTAAYNSPGGRARLALAFTLGEWSPWLADDTPRPASNNPDEIATSIYDSVMRLAGSPGGEARIIFENAAKGQQLSWNDNVDYKSFYENANPAMKRAVQHLYEEANVDINSDFDALDNEPRISASDYALEYWNQPGRTAKGRIKIPVMRLHMLGDYQIPYSLVKGYTDLITENNNDDLYRTAYIDSTGHCNFSAAESLAAVEIVIKRIDSGEWHDTDPDSLNDFANSFRTNSPARFMPISDWQVEKYNRTWAPEAFGTAQ